MCWELQSKLIDRFGGTEFVRRWTALFRCFSLGLFMLVKAPRPRLYAHRLCIGMCHVVCVCFSPSADPTHFFSSSLQCMCMYVHVCVHTLVFVLSVIVASAGRGLCFPLQSVCVKECVWNRKNTCTSCSSLLLVCLEFSCSGMHSGS